MAFQARPRLCGRRPQTRGSPRVGVFLGRGCISPILFWRLTQLGQGPKGPP